MDGPPSPPGGVCGSPGVFASRGTGEAGGLLVWEIPPPSRPPFASPVAANLHPHPDPQDLSRAPMLPITRTAFPVAPPCPQGRGVFGDRSVPLRSQPFLSTALAAHPLRWLRAAAGRVLTCSESERARDFVLDIFICSTRLQHSVLFLHPDPEPVLPVLPVRSRRDGAWRGLREVLLAGAALTCVVWVRRFSEKSFKIICFKMVSRATILALGFLRVN